MGTDTSKQSSELFPILIMGLFFVIIQGFAILIASLFEPAFEDKGDPVNLLYFFVIILVMTAVILLIAKFWKKQLIQLIILGAVGYTSFFVFWHILSLWLTGYLLLVTAIAIAGGLTLLLFKYPEWYVIDISGVIIGAGAIAIFGISLEIYLIMILLIVLAVYDAISVYKTKHMVDLADTVMDLKLPVLLVVPKIRHYSLLKKQKGLKEQLDSGEERDAFFMGLGDIVMPGILVVAAYYTDTVNQSLPLAFSTMAGTLVGFAILMLYVVKGKPQAGLPLLCSGAILGYLLGSLLFYQNLVGFPI